MKKRSYLLLVMALCSAFPLVFWAQTLERGLPWPVFLYDTGRLLSLLLFVLVFFQYILSSGIKWIEKGIGLDALLNLHRIIGVTIFFAVPVHPLLLLVSERLQGYETPFTFMKILGVASLLLIWAGAGVAMLYGKVNMKYETWKGIHRIGYAVLPIAFMHSYFMGSTLQKAPLKNFWILLALGYVAAGVNRLRRRRVLRNRPMTVKEVSRETEHIRCLLFEGSHPSYEPGQFMMLQLERGGVVSAPHPFTIASSPSREGLSICVKSSGDFTSSIKETKRLDRAYIDMPYGVFTFLRHDAHRLIFIAGGIGITPFLSMLRYIRDRSLEKEILLIWSNKKEKDIAFREELEKAASEISSLTIIHVLTRQEDWPGEKGRIDRTLLRKYIGDFEKGEFFLCGPPPMMNSVRRNLLQLGVRKNRIHMERFALR